MDETEYNLKSVARDYVAFISKEDYDDDLEYSFFVLLETAVLRRRLAINEAVCVEIDAEL